ncbi:MAG: hypothetical protein RBT63_04280 [Bdellovibrionales bacterium]|jgi:hypothetical protein|nr:hypothetical protein [Bdellovibrionales bacterium]
MRDARFFPAGVALVLAAISFISSNSLASCLIVQTPLEIGQCRANPESKTYSGSADPDGVWSYSCEYSCLTGNGSTETVIGAHRGRETGELNELVCHGVLLDLVQKEGASYKQCRMRIENLEILASNVAGIAELKNEAPHRTFLKTNEARSRLVHKLIQDLHKTALYYEGMAKAASAPARGNQRTNQSQPFFGDTANDLKDFIAILNHTRLPASNAPTPHLFSTLDRYLHHIENGNLSDASLTMSERFALTHLLVHRTAILNLLGNHPTWRSKARAID